jgi:predicted nucleic acid-binding Zn ribbon protein
MNTKTYGESACVVCGSQFTKLSPSTMTCSPKCGQKRRQTRPNAYARTYKYRFPDGNYQHYLDVTNCELCGVTFEGTNKKCQDHDHKTGKTRKVICHRCNQLLGCLEREGLPTIDLTKIEDYLKC